MSKHKVEIAYSVVIILAIPAILIANTLILANSTRQDYVTELRRKADLVNLAISSAVVKDMSAGDTGALNDYINNLTSQAPVLYSVYIVDTTNDDIKVIASNKNIKNLEVYQLQHIKIAKDSDRAVERSAKSVDAKGNNVTLMEIATPIKNDEGKTIAVAVSGLTTADADELMDATLLKSYIFLAISVIAVVALLIHHFRLAGYSRLLAKQKETNQAMSDFLSVATHELKAPASIIRGYVSNVMDGTFGEVSNDVKAQLSVAINQTDRLNILVKDLLNVSRIEQGRVEYDLQPVDIQPIISLIVDNYRPIAKAKELELTYNIESNAIVTADAGRAQEIFTNLIDNAVKYTVTGSVNISSSISKEHLVVKVRDTGFGISTEHRKRLFQRFYRVPTDETKEISGTGLGLWIIKQYIESMGGKIEVDSLVGSGTEFIVYMPLAKS